MRRHFSHVVAQVVRQGGVAVEIAGKSSRSIDNQLMIACRKLLAPSSQLPHSFIPFQLIIQHLLTKHKLLNVIKRAVVQMEIVFIKSKVSVECVYTYICIVGYF